MVAVSVAEVAPGLVVHLQPEELVRIGGCLVKCPPGTEVRDKHFFLIVDVDATRGACVAFPLYSQKQGIRDHLLLDERGKSGRPQHWIGRKSYYFKWQFWSIPVASVPAASFDEDSEPATRRRYGATDPGSLMGIVRAMGRSRDEWRPPVFG